MLQEEGRDQSASLTTGGCRGSSIKKGDEKDYFTAMSRQTKITERVAEYEVKTFEPNLRTHTIKTQGGGLTSSGVPKHRGGSDLNFRVQGGRFGGNIVGSNTTGRPAFSNNAPRSASQGQRVDESGERGRIVSGNKTKRGQWDVSGSLGASKGGKKEPDGPPRSSKAGRNRGVTTFQIFYDNSDIPVTLENDVHGTSLKWLDGVSDPSHLDYHHYLPLFCDGLRETKHPYDVLAEAGVKDLLRAAPNKVLNVVPQLILPIKNALETHDRRVICRTLRVIQQLIQCDMVGEALVPYYRQILPVLNFFKGKNKNLGDQIDYGQQKGENIGDLIDDTLNMLETYGGPDAYINIKYMIPTYESCVLN